MKKRILIAIITICSLLTSFVYADTSTAVLSNTYYTNDKIDYKFKAPIGWGVTENATGEGYSLFLVSPDEKIEFMVVRNDGEMILFNEELAFYFVKAFYKDLSPAKLLSEESVMLDGGKRLLRCYTGESSEDGKVIYTYATALKEKNSNRGYIIIAKANADAWEPNKSMIKQMLMSFVNKGDTAEAIDTSDDTNINLDYNYFLPQGWKVTDKSSQLAYGIVASSSKGGPAFSYMRFGKIFDEEFLTQELILSNPTYVSLGIEHPVINNKETTLYAYNLKMDDGTKMNRYTAIFQAKGYNHVVSAEATENAWEQNKDMLKKMVLSFAFKNGDVFNFDKVDKNLNIKSTKELADYLNSKMSTIDTPMGKYNFEFKVSDNNSLLKPYDIDIRTDWLSGNTDPFSICASLKYNTAQKAQTRALLRDFQMKAAETAMYYFPDKKINGGYYYGYYKYPATKLDYQTIQFLSWNNYGNIKDNLAAGSNLYSNTQLGSFRWIPKQDAFDLTE